ncbi:unnamed protein product [Penicillium salamii]|uniref:Protamine P1 n=1 Tax=Penicillium salamii TaxID=1612424 RepID=A0A9W4ILF8_9EURO|nr:unnamed protein product [Penicillium salamii]CAG8065264.1 unnamed protein product [Penicillium salamii]CAG8260120.1 unnamed protein product [Penicillium salamii]CAG8313573.1 unnamed protein product [Penicillium salamii]CAG8321146.1 unnamed protein product [Penicillium salamii]
MPYPRPISPLSLETCASPPHGNDSDELLGSDDELDEDSRAVKRQRIEKLAESYLQGRPLFILSASLKGPLDEEWENPWKKTRKHGGDPSASPDCQTKGPERIVTETDLRPPKFRKSLSAGSRGPEIPASSLNYVERASVHPENRSSSSRSPRRDSIQSSSRPGRGSSNVITRSPVKSTGPLSSPAKAQSVVPPRTANWLKKDRRLMNFTKFDPPSSPTLSITSRQSDKSYRPSTRSVQVQVPQTPASPSKLRPTKIVPPKTVQSSSQGHRSPGSTHSVASTSHQIHQVAQQSPLRRAQATADPPSLRIVNSSSQLPRFEYRRCHTEKSRSPLEDESILQEETILHDEIPREKTATVSPPVSSAKRNIVEPIPSGSDKPPANPPSSQSINVLPLGADAPESPQHESAPKQAFIKEAESHKTLSKDLRFADETDVANEDEEATFQGTAPSTELDQNATEQNTCDDLPSAQQVPAPLGVSDRITSLHSTALPRANSDLSSSASPETQLSTQAALSHAQKSFQDDLDSPAYYATTPGQNKAVHSPSGTTYSANVTPFYRIEESIRRDLERTSLSANKDRMHAMSTQFMLDAATPFNFSTEQAGQDASWKPANKSMTQAMNTQFMLDTATPYAFSTEKKPRAPRPDSAKSMTAGSKRKQRHDASNSGSPKSDSISVDYKYHSTESNQGGSEINSPRITQQPDHQSIDHPSLLLDLGEATPAAGQDGQGANQAVESFNLSQAIADAGSWLQQSFDFMKDTGRPSQSLQRQSLNMDLS